LIWYYHLYFAGNNSLEIALDIKHALFLLIVNLGAFVVYHTSVQLLITQDENAKLTQNNYLLTLQNVQYENLQQRIDEARRAKHDVRHHVHLTLEYLRSGKLSELETYLEQYSNSLPDTKSNLYCPNYEINTMLNYFAQQAQEHGIAMDVFVQFPKEIALTETTLSVLFGNLLENAVDACKDVTDGEKKITVRGKVSKGFVYFDISNNYAGTLSKAKNGNYLTTKKNGKGMGLQSVAHLVKLHDGVFETDAKDNIFRVSVMLQEQPRV
jgi:sensor histidine kinase regulating citrate/malate metabolism